MKILDMKIRWPEVKIPEGFNDAESYLRHLVYQGAKGRFVYELMSDRNVVCL